jgi:hypothetical protein
MLVVVYKPAGFCRECSSDEVVRFLSHWTVLRHVVVSRNVGNQKRGVVETVLNAAKERQSKETEYSVSEWREALLCNPGHDLGRIAGPMHLSGLASAILRDGLGLHLHETICCWLNRVTIEMIYGMSPSFQDHRELLVPLLMGGPSRIDTWSGSAEMAAFGLKLLVRAEFGRGPLTNLLHVEKTTAEIAAGIYRTLLL